MSMFVHIIVAIKKKYYYNKEAIAGYMLRHSEVRKPGRVAWVILIRYL
jgi:hypothetical protein